MLTVTPSPGAETSELAVLEGLASGRPLITVTEDLTIFIVAA